MLQDILIELGSEWEAFDDDSIVSCCGIELELDAESCPECGADNPILLLGLI